MKKSAAGILTRRGMIPTRLPARARQARQVMYALSAQAAVAQSQGCNGTFTQRSASHQAASSNK